jgi:ATP-binding cassette subfamily B protein
MAIMQPFLFFVLSMTMLGVVWFGAKKIDIGVLQIGNMIAFMQYAMQSMFAFFMITMVIIMIPRASVSFGRLAEILNTEPKIKDPEHPVPFVVGQASRIEFKDVTFAYGGADAPVLHDISFTAEPGQTTAFVGSTGSGKSTLINLIPRFYDPTSGAIMINGVDIRQVKQEDLYRQIGYVPQRGVLFSGTVDSNIGYGAPEASREELSHAADIAQAKEFISELTGGFDAPIAQGGTNVSGGQKQRLSIARAIARQPNIYIFDDSFSALDFTTDAKLRAALKQATSGKTVLIVAQRISTIMNADKIVVLDEGRIVGQGTHTELMKSCQVYREIALSQLSETELDTAPRALATEGGAAV